jgi:hypothetical protein
MRTTTKVFAAALMLSGLALLIAGSAEMLRLAGVYFRSTRPSKSGQRRLRPECAQLDIIGKQRVDSR